MSDAARCQFVFPKNHRMSSKAQRRLRVGKLYWERQLPRDKREAPSGLPMGSLPKGGFVEQNHEVATNYDQPIR